MAAEKGDVGFVPRDMFAQTGAFGRTYATPPPAPGVDMHDWRYRTAVFQHRFANIVNEGLDLRGRNRGDFLAPYADVRSLGVGRMGRVLRGEQVATMADVSFWAEHFPELLKGLGEFFVWWAKDQEQLRQKQREQQS